jgi:hypothetical protein
MIKFQQAPALAVACRCHFLVFPRVQGPIRTFSEAFPRVRMPVITLCSTSPHVRKRVMTLCSGLPRVRKPILTLCSGHPCVRKCIVTLCSAYPHARKPVVNLCSARPHVRRRVEILTVRFRTHKYALFHQPMPFRTNDGPSKKCPSIPMNAEMGLTMTQSGQRVQRRWRNVSGRLLACACRAWKTRPENKNAGVETPA